MKTKIFFFVLIVFFAGYMLSSCHGSGKHKSSTDSLDSSKVEKDSLKKNEGALPKLLVVKASMVNLRVEPGVKAKKIKQLKANDTCEVLDKSKLDTVDGKIDYWYKIKFKTKEGWVFGEFTSLKMLQNKKEKQKIFPKGGK